MFPNKLISVFLFLSLFLIPINCYAWWAAHFGSGFTGNRCIRSDSPLATPNGIFKHVTTEEMGYSECKIFYPETGVAMIWCKKPGEGDFWIRAKSQALCNEYLDLKKDREIFEKLKKK